MRDRVRGHRAPLWKKALLGLVLVAVAVGLVFGMLAMGEREDRERAMYHDTIQMAGLQHDLLRRGQEGVEMSIDHESGPLLVGSEPFTPQPGVEVVVEQRGETYCVKGSNQYGDETRWLCVDGTGDRPDAAVLEKEF